MKNALLLRFACTPHGLRGVSRLLRRGQKSCAGGFTLVEIAISLVLLSLAAVGVFAILEQQIEQHRISDTNATLLKAHDAVLSFVTAYGRLPCPAVVGSNGAESIASNVGGIITCTREAGFLPAVTLGMPNLDQWGLLEGAWNDGAGSQNGTFVRAIRYAVTGLAAPTAWTLTSVSLGAPGSPTQRAAVQTSFNNNQGLFVCASGAGIVAAGNRCGPVAANTLSSNAAVIIWSLGSDAADIPNYSADELQNYNLTVPRVVINRVYAPLGAAGGQFDDLVTWISYPIIADRLVYAGFVQ
ncbi:MAG TPA: prepilin-type N-terminal cleavage/methylation domain-containing protein [Burkholderiaceae bacterium]|nr:prepilin-type N-terminal cleavage/methylation domain-containing protein [Burkholderiaceae bacterium]